MGLLISPPDLACFLIWQAICIPDFYPDWGDIILKIINRMKMLENPRAVESIL
jgi:hypothetical protein